MPPADNMPDFDSMSQEEIMAWMETLAKRQGANLNELTTAADSNVAEIDPNSVVIDEPGYVPYGQSSSAASQPKTQPTPPPAEPPKVEQPSAPASEVPEVEQPPAPVSRPPLPRPEPRQAEQPPAPPRRVEPIRVERPTPPPARAPEPEREPEPAATPPAASADDGTLAWLESLAADQTDDLFNLDLTTLPVDDNPTPIPTTPERANPLSWLESLTASQGEPQPALESLDDDDDDEPSEKIDPFAEGVDPMEWMETLARRQGADPEELTTSANLNVPQLDDEDVEGLEYEPFSFDTYPVSRQAQQTEPEPAAVENPEDFLRSLASGEGYGDGETTEPPAARAAAPRQDEMSMDAIQAAIADGTVTREQMQVFLEQQAQLAQEAEPLEDEEDVEVEEPLAPAEIPDWMSDFMPQDEPAEPPAPTAPLEAIFDQQPPAAMPDMPDWLLDEEPDVDSLGLESIFDEPAETPTPQSSVETPAAEAAYAGEYDPDDPWAEAFDLEQTNGMDDINTVPEWYQQNVNDPRRIADVERRAGIAADESKLRDSALPPESDLIAGQPTITPDWMRELLPTASFPDFTEDEAEEEIVEAEAVVIEDEDEMPDWLREVEASVSPDEVPEWLREPLAEDEALPDLDLPSVVAAPEPEPQPEPQRQPEPARAQTPPQQPKPAPKPQPAPQPERTYSDPEEVRAALEAARDKEQSGDLEGSLSEYEQLIRMNIHVDVVVADLQQLVKSYKSVPAVYRVLGDGLMRQGKLQAALDTYREALNQL